MDPIDDALFVNDVYESKIIQYLGDNLPLNAVFVDKSANIGAISFL